VAYLGLSNAKAIVHQMEGATAHEVERLLHISGEASAHEVERLVHMKWRG